MTYETKDITAENSFTNALEITGEFNLSIYGTFSATVTLQRSFDAGTTWHDVNSWTAPFEGVDTEPALRDYGVTPVVAQYRVGVKTGGYTSGTANVRLGHS